MLPILLLKQDVLLLHAPTAEGRHCRAAEPLMKDYAKSLAQREVDDEVDGGGKYFHGIAQLHQVEGDRGTALLLIAPGDVDELGRAVTRDKHQHYYYHYLQSNTHSTM